MCITVKSPKRTIGNIFQKYENVSVGPTIYPLIHPLNTYVLSIYCVQGTRDPKVRVT